MSELPAVRDELRAMEPILHRLPEAADRTTIDELLEPGYFEVGASGSPYSRDLVLDVVERRYRNGVDPDENAWVVNDFAVHALAEHVYLVTYRLTYVGRESRRSTVWRRHGQGWRAAYHQGTPCT